MVKKVIKKTNSLTKEQIIKRVKAVINGKKYDEEYQSRLPNYEREYSRLKNEFNHCRGKISNYENGILNTQSQIEHHSTIINPTPDENLTEGKFDPNFICQCIQKIQFLREKINEEYQRMNEIQQLIIEAEKLLHLYRVDKENALFHEWELLLAIGETSLEWTAWKNIQNQ
jgi:hypothetical protein